MALLPRPNPTPDSKSPCKGLSEFVVGLSGTYFFTRLDSGEQCDSKIYTVLTVIEAAVTTL